MLHRALRRVSPSMAISLLALFLALGGVGYSATGDSFILGKPNSATSQSTLSAATPGKTLVLTNTDTSATSRALALNVPAGHPPFEVNSGTKVANLNADRLDDLNANNFAQLGVPQTATAGGALGVIDVTNSANGNGVAGRTSDVGASGVYGQNVGNQGYGVAGRAGANGIAVYGDNPAGGYAGYFKGRLLVSADIVCQIQCLAGDRVNGKVDDAGTLDGIDSTGFVQGAGQVDRRAIAIAPSTIAFLDDPLFGLLRLRYSCPSTQGFPGTLTIVNSSAGALNLFVERKGVTSFSQPASAASVSFPADPGGEEFHVQAQGFGGVVTIEAATVNRTTDCHAQAQGLLTP
jgi:hypothetical protein